jgi:membrane protein implicated in regulation of membrane protease activity
VGSDSRQSTSLSQLMVDSRSWGPLSSRTPTVNDANCDVRLKEGVLVDWWIWTVVGLAFLAFEVMTPGGIIMLFFGAAAIVVGVLVGLGIPGPLWVQLALFSFLSIISLLTLRGAILRRFEDGGDDHEEIDSLLGKTVIVAEEIITGGMGKAEIHGSSWSVQNIGQEPIAKGQIATIEHVEGLRLDIRSTQP